MSTRYSPWERATRGQAAAMAAAHAAQQTQQNQLADFGGKVRHWERMKVRVHAHQGFGPGGETLHLGGFNLTKWMATDTPLAQDLCEPPKGIVPVKVPFKRARSPTPDPEEQAAKLPPRRSSRLSMSQLADQQIGTRPGTPLPVLSQPASTPPVPSTSVQPVQPEPKVVPEKEKTTTQPVVVSDAVDPSPPPAPASASASTPPVVETAPAPTPTPIQEERAPQKAKEEQDQPQPTSTSTPATANENANENEESKEKEQQEAAKTPPPLQTGQTTPMEAEPKEGGTGT